MTNASKRIAAKNAKSIIDYDIGYRSNMAKQYAKEAAYLRKNRTAISKITEMLHGCGYCNLGARVYGQVPRLTISGTINDLDGFKDERLISLLGRFTTVSEKETTEDYAENLGRSYTFEWVARINGGDVQVTATIYSYVRGDSETCRKVLVGETERVVTDRSYKIICD